MIKISLKFSYGSFLRTFQHCLRITVGFEVGVYTAYLKWKFLENSSNHKTLSSRVSEATSWNIVYRREVNKCKYCDWFGNQQTQSSKCFILITYLDVIGAILVPEWPVMSKQISFWYSSQTVSFVYFLTLIQMEPKVICLCPQYRTRPACTSVHSDYSVG